MNCKYFGECGSCTLYELTYEEQIKRKQKYLKELFSSLHVENFFSISPKELAIIELAPAALLGSDTKREFFVLLKSFFALLKSSI